MAEAKKRGFEVFYQDIEEEASGDCQYDVVCVFDVLEHVKHDDLALKNIYKLLKPGGFLIFTVPAFNFLFSSHDVYLKHYRRYSKKELNQKLADNNFKMLNLYYWNSVLFPLIALKRLISKRNKPKSDASNLPKLLNWFLYEILIIENQLIKMNVMWPFGLSLIGVARKGD